LHSEAAANGVTLGLGVVNRYETNLLNNADQALAFIAEVDEPNVDVHLDTYHMNIEEDDMLGPVRRCGDKLVYVHVGESHRGYLARVRSISRLSSRLSPRRATQGRSRSRVFSSATRLADAVEHLRRVAYVRKRDNEHRIYRDPSNSSLSRHFTRRFVMNTVIMPTSGLCRCRRGSGGCTPRVSC
jgi:hypothetical protein